MADCDCATNGNTVRIFPKVSVLPTDYTILDNLPKINGVTLLGEITTQQLNLLSSDIEKYETISLADCKDKYVVVLGGEEPKKMLISNLSLSGNNSGFETSDLLNLDVAVGVYQFVEIK